MRFALAALFSLILIPTAAGQCPAPQNPTISSISPTAGFPGLNTTVTIAGSNFISGNTAAFLNGFTESTQYMLTTTFVNSAQLTAVVPSSLLTHAVNDEQTWQLQIYVSNFTIQNGQQCNSANSGKFTFGINDFFFAQVQPVVAGGVVQAGQSLTYNFGVDDYGFGAFVVMMSCTGLPAGASCNFPPSPISPCNGLQGCSPPFQFTLATSATTPPGSYTFNIVGTFPGGSHSTATTVSVTGGQPQLTATPSSINAQVAAGGTGSASLLIGNSGGGSINWNLMSSTSNGGNWLSPNGASGSVASTPQAVQVLFNASALAPGLYTGTIALSPGNLTIPVRLSVIGAGPALALGQSGVTLTAAQGASVSQSVPVGNAGSGTLNWTATVVSGGGVTVTPGSGASSAGAATSFTATLNAAGRTAGTTYALIQVSAPGAANSPQYLTVVENVQVASAALPLAASPQGLIFVSKNGATPAPQTVTLTNAGAASQTATTGVATQSGGGWLSVSSPSLSVASAGTITVNAAPGTLGAGIYAGTVTISSSNSVTQTPIAVYLVVTSGSAVRPLDRALASTCSPTGLVMAMQELGSNFATSVGWGTDLQALVLDNCGNAATTATVIASFSNGDPPLALNYLGNGIYSATWKPATATAATVTVQAIEAPLAPATVTITGQVGANAAPPPAVGSGGVVNGASFAAGQDLAPGSIISVFGTNLASSNGTQATVLPLPTTLANIKLTIGGIDAPLFYAGTGQVNAQIPFELAAGSQSQVVARAIPASGAELDATPEPIVVGSVHPGIFIASGTQGAILNVANNLVNAANPAHAGDIIVIYCTGLGAVSPAAQTGQPAASGTATVQPTVTVGGAAASVQYAGVAPTYVGLYQVNVVVPAGSSTGSSVPVVITQNGVASNTATIAVH